MGYLKYPIISSLQACQSYAYFSFPKQLSYLIHVLFPSGPEIVRVRDTRVCSFALCHWVFIKICNIYAQLQGSVSILEPLHLALWNTIKCSWIKNYPIIMYY